MKPGTTVEEARDFVVRHRVDGIDCPVCDQYVHVQPRTIHAAMGRFLVELLAHHDRNPGRFVHTREVFPDAEKASTDAAYLVHWGLVERHRHGRGQYRATDAAVAFVRNGARVPRFVDIQNNKVVGIRGTMTFHDAMGVNPDQTGLFP